MVNIASTASIAISGTIGTEPEGTMTLSGTFTNSTSVGTLVQSTFSTGIGGATTFAVPANARWAFIAPGQVTGTVPTYYANSTVGATTAICALMISSGGALLPVGTSVLSGGKGSTLVFFTSAAVWGSTPLRVVFF